MSSAASVPEQIAALDRSGVERMAAAVLHEIAGQSLRPGRPITTAAREAAQLHHLAARLEAFANAE